MDGAGSLPSNENQSIGYGSLPRSVLTSLIADAQYLRTDGINESFPTRWQVINFSDMLLLNITFSDVEFLNASEVVREVDPLTGFVKQPEGINDVYVVRGDATELTTNEQGTYQFILTKSILFGSIDLLERYVWIEPEKKTIQEMNNKKQGETKGEFNYKVEIIRRSQRKPMKAELLVSKAMTSSSVSATAATKTALTVAAGTGSFYQEWGSDLAAAIVYNIDGADQYTWWNEGSYFVGKDANDVFTQYFGLSLSIKRIFYWSSGGPGGYDPSYCGLLADKTADFIRGLSPSDPVFPFHIMTIFSGKDLLNANGDASVLGCTNKIGNFKYVMSPSDIPTTNDVPIAAIESRRSTSAHERRYTTAHEIGHILDGTHGNAGTLWLYKSPFFGETGTWCDAIYPTITLYAKTLMSDGYSGTVVCISLWTYSDFFISDNNYQRMLAVINSVYN